MKTRRQETILRLIAQHKIETQEEMQSLLLQNGFSVTQATLSRDIRELKLIKAPEGGGYRYVAPAGKSDGSLKSSELFLRSVLKVDFSGNMVVIKCGNGMANAVCVAVDAAGEGEIVGTIAGDDTIFVLMRNAKSAEAFANSLK